MASKLIRKELIHILDFSDFYIALIFRKNNITNKIYIDEYVEIKDWEDGRKDLNATKEERKKFGINKIIKKEKSIMKQMLIARGW